MSFSVYQLTPIPPRPEIPPDLKDAGCTWIYRGTCPGKPRPPAKGDWQSWELAFGNTTGAPMLGWIATKFSPVRFVAHGSFSLRIITPAKTPKLLGKFSTLEAAARAIYKHARKEIAKAIRARLSA